MTSKKEQSYIRRIAELEKQLKQRDERIAALEKQVAELVKVNAELADKVAKLSKNSSNSSKPPSSDIVKPPRNIDLHLVFMPNLQFSATADFSRPNVFVIEGSKGTPSPYSLVLTTGTTGSGAAKIYDEDTIEKQMLVIHN